jgi:hypothetical protein
MTRRPDNSPPWVPGNVNDRSINGFCIRHGSSRGPMSRSKFYGMQHEGVGPRLTAIGKRQVIITVEDERRWDAERSDPTTTEGKLFVKEAAERRRQRALGAMAAARRNPNFARGGRPPRAPPAPRRRARPNDRARSAPP